MVENKQQVSYCSGCAWRALLLSWLPVAAACWLGVSVTLSKRRSLNRCSIRSSVPVQTNWSSTGFVSSFLQKKLQELYSWVLFTCLLVFDFTFWPLVMVKVASQLKSQERDEHLTEKSIGKQWNSVISTTIYMYIIHIYLYVFFPIHYQRWRLPHRRSGRFPFIRWFGLAVNMMTVLAASLFFTMPLPERPSFKTLAL